MAFFALSIMVFAHFGSLIFMLSGLVPLMMVLVCEAASSLRQRTVGHRKQRQSLESNVF
jgi:hypothetical protein